MTYATRCERNLAMQGFAIDADGSIHRVERWLRLTPSLSSLWIATGTALASPAMLLAFAAVSALGASRREHPFDRLYDRFIRPLARSERLPENPPPRRFAMALASAWAATAALLFATGRRRTGRVAGALLAGAGATVATTHFCLGSWTYHQLVDRVSPASPARRRGAAGSAGRPSRTPPAPSSATAAATPPRRP